MEKNLFIVGHYGAYNIGDDAMLHGIVNALKQEGYKKITVLSKDGNYPYYASLGVELIQETKKSLIEGIRKADIILFGGGTYIHDTIGNKQFKNKGLYKSLLVLLTARMFFKKVCFVGIGIGPILTKKTARISRFIFRNADYVSVRDMDSYRQMLEINVGNSVKTFDASINCKPLLNGRRPEGYVGINIIPYFGMYYNQPEKDKEVLDYYTSMIHRFREHDPSLKFKFFIFNSKKSESELGIVEELISRLPEDVQHTIVTYTDVKAFLDEMASCNYYVGMRYHGVALAYLAGIPQLVLAYQKKCLSFAAEVGIPSSLTMSVNSLNEADLLAATEELLEKSGGSHYEYPAESAHSVFKENFFPKWISEKS